MPTLFQLTTIRTTNYTAMLQGAIGEMSNISQNIRNVTTTNGSTSIVGNIHEIVIAGGAGNLDQTLTEYRNAVFLTDPQLDREALISTKGKITKGTCEWIRDNNIYKSWLGGGSQFLWISGGPGKGKTMLSIFLGHELECRRQKSDDHVLFYFCSHQSEKNNTAVTVLRGLVYQLLRLATDKSQLDQIRHYFEGPAVRESTRSNPEALWVVFEQLVRSLHLGTLFCVLDGLDECDDESTRLLISKFRGFFSRDFTTTGAFKLAIVSQDMSGLVGVPRVKLEPDNDENVSNDVLRFISASIQELHQIDGFSADHRSIIQTTLTERAEGTFLWVGFVMAELSRKKTRSQILDALDTTPRGLHEVFDRMLHQIDSGGRGIGALILRNVALALERLSVDQLAHATGIERGLIGDSITLCKPFLRLHQGRVSLVHQSAKNYLLREEPASDSVLETFRISPTKGHLEMARACLDIIENSPLKHSPLSPEALDRESQQFPLLRYAVKYWPEHARRSSTSVNDLLSSHRPFFQTDSKVQGNWRKTFNPHGRVADAALPLLHLASYLGITRWVEMELDKKRRFPLWPRAVNRKHRNRTPLHWAIVGKRLTTARVLLDRGARVDALALRFCCAVQLASEGSDLSMDRLLWDHGARYSKRGHWSTLGKLNLLGEGWGVKFSTTYASDVDVK